MAADSTGIEPANRAVALLQRELMIKCHATTEQFQIVPTQESQAAASERIAYGVLVAALEEGLVTTLLHAMDVLK